MSEATLPNFHLKEIAVCLPTTKLIFDYFVSKNNVHCCYSSKYFNVLQIKAAISAKFIKIPMLKYIVVVRFHSVHQVVFIADNLH